MAKYTKNSRKKDHHISSITSTNDCLTNRAGLTFFAAYLQSIQLIPIMEKMFCSIRKNKKASLLSICFFNCCVFLWMVPAVTSHGLIVLKTKRVMPH